MKRAPALFVLISVSSGLLAAVACTTPESETPSSSSAVSIDPSLVVPSNADLVYDVSGGLAGTQESFGLDRVSLRGAAKGRAITIVEERSIGSSTSHLVTTAKGYISYALSESPRFAFDLLSAPADSAAATWVPVDGVIRNAALSASSAADGSLATVEVHELRAVDSASFPEGRLYRALFDGRRKLVEDAATAGGATNADWAYRNVIVTSGVADYFVPRGSSEILLLRAAEYRLLGDDVRFSATESLEGLRAAASSPDTYVTLRCLREAPQGAKSALAAWPASGLAIDSCK